MMQKEEALMEHGKDDNVKVLIRVRPLNDRETNFNKKCLTVDADNNVVILNAKPQPKVYSFDRVCGEDSTQEQIFHAVGRKVTDQCMQGYNGTIFAYGQTGSGKTHTVLGNEDMRGLVPRVLDYLFSSINRQQLKSAGRMQYLCRCSVLEIYNENVFDLLDSAATGLQLREDMTKGVYVDGLTEQVVADALEAEAVVNIGIRNRRVGETAMNRESSRSHCVFTLTIEASEIENDIKRTRKARFNMVDLAGSERQKSTEAAGDRLKEASSINKSLSALGNVIMSLVEKAKGKSRHVHYRDSRLTFLLKDSLGGNSKSYIIANVSPSEDSFGETLSTLKFAQRAKMIKNNAVVNEDSSGTLIQLKKDLIEAREQLMHYKANPNSSQTNPGEQSPETAELSRALEQGLSRFHQDKASADAFIAALVRKNEMLQTGIDRLHGSLDSQRLVAKLRAAQIERCVTATSGEAATVMDDCKEAWAEERKALEEQLRAPPESVELLLKCDELESELEICRRGEEEPMEGGYESIRDSLYEWTSRLLDQLTKHNGLLEEHNRLMAANAESADIPAKEEEAKEEEAKEDGSKVSASVAAELYASIEDLKSQLHQKTAQAEGAAKGRDEVQEQLDALKASHTEREEALGSELRQKEHLEMQVATLETRVSTERSMYEERLGSLSAQCASNQVAGDERAKIEHELREQLAGAFKDQAVLKQNLDTMNLQMQQQEAQFAKAKAKHEKEMAQLKLQAKRVEDETVSAFEEYVKETEEAKAGTQRQLEALRHAADASKQGEEKVSVQLKEEASRRQHAEGELAQCEEQLHAAEGHLSRLQKEHSAVKQQAEKMEFTLESLQEDNETLSEQNHFTESALEDERGRVKKLQEELELSSHHAQSLTSQLASMQGEIGSEKQQLSATIEACTAAEKRLEDAEVALASTHAEQEKLKTQLKEQLRQAQGAEREQAAALLDMQAQLQVARRTAEEHGAAAEDAKAGLQAAQGETAALSAQLEVAKEATARVEEERAVKEAKEAARIEDAQRELQTARADCDALEKKLQESKTALQEHAKLTAEQHAKAMNRAAATHDERVKAMEKVQKEAMQASKQQLDAATASLSTLRSEAHAAHAEAEALQAERRSAAEASDRLTREREHTLNELRRENASLGERLSGIRDALEASNVLPESEGGDGADTSAENNAEPAIAALHSRQQQIIALKAELKSARVEVAKATDACRAAESKAETLSVQLTESRSAIELSESQQKQLKIQLDQSETCGSKLREQVQALEETAEQKRAEILQQMQQMETMRTSKQEEVSALQKEAQDRASQIESLEQEAAAMRDAGACVEKEAAERVQALQAEVQDVTAKLESASAGGEESAQRCATALAAVEKLSAEKEALGEQRLMWRKEIETVQALEEETFKAKEAATEALESTKAETARLVKELQMATQARDKLKEQNAKLIGHQNPRQKIQLHVKIKEENNELRRNAQAMSEQIYTLQQKLRALGDTSFKEEKGKDKENAHTHNTQNDSAVTGVKKKITEGEKHRKTLETICKLLCAGGVDQSLDAEKIINLLKHLQMKEKESMRRMKSKDREIVNLTAQLRIVKLDGEIGEEAHSEPMEGMRSESPPVNPFTRTPFSDAAVTTTGAQ